MYTGDDGEKEGSQERAGLGLLALWPLPLTGAEGGHRSLCALFRNGGS